MLWAYIIFVYIHLETREYHITYIPQCVKNVFNIYDTEQMYLHCSKGLTSLVYLVAPSDSSSSSNNSRPMVSRYQSLKVMLGYCYALCRTRALDGMDPPVWLQFNHIIPIVSSQIVFLYYFVISVTYIRKLRNESTVELVI